MQDFSERLAYEAAPQTLEPFQHEFSPAPLVWFAFLALRVTIAKDIPSQGGSALVIA